MRQDLLHAALGTLEPAPAPSDAQRHAEFYHYEYLQCAGRSLCADGHSLLRIGQALYAKYDSLPEAFRKFDTDSSEDISLSEFEAGIADLLMPGTSECLPHTVPHVLPYLLFSFGAIPSEPSPPAATRVYFLEFIPGSGSTLPA